jgi:cell division protein FtsB
MVTRRQLAFGSVGVAVLLATISVVDARGFRRYASLRQELVQLSDKNRELLEKNRQMARELEALRADPRALERAAREELGFVKPGEIVVNLE